MVVAAALHGRLVCLCKYINCSGKACGEEYRQAISKVYNVLSDQTIVARGGIQGRYRNQAFRRTGGLFARKKQAGPVGQT